MKCTHLSELLKEKMKGYERNTRPNNHATASLMSGKNQHAAHDAPSFTRVVGYFTNEALTEVEPLFLPGLSHRSARVLEQVDHASQLPHASLLRPSCPWYSRLCNSFLASMSRGRRVCGASASFLSLPPSLPPCLHRLSLSTGRMCVKRFHVLQGCTAKHTEPGD